MAQYKIFREPHNRQKIYYYAIWSFQTVTISITVSNHQYYLKSSLELMIKSNISLYNNIILLRVHSEPKAVQT
jgi:hypothetical protein